MTREGKLLKEFSETNFYDVIINRPTRITDTSSSILDQCLTNVPYYVEDYDILMPISTSDHCVIAIYFTLKCNKQNTYSRTMWSFSETSVDAFKVAVSQYDWQSILYCTDINECCMLWTEAVQKLAKATIPNKKVTIRPLDKP